MYSIHVDKHILTDELCGTNLVEKETQTDFFDTSNAELFTENEFAFLSQMVLALKHYLLCIKYFIN